LNVLEEVFKDQINDKDYKQKLEIKFSEYLKYTRENLDRILIGPKLSKNK